MLGDGDRQKILRDLMLARDPLYREIADLVVETDGRRVQKVAKEIFDLL
jgi:shikimate kinase